MRPTPAVFASSFHPHVGGVEELVKQLAIEQRRRGSDTVVVTNRYPKSLLHRDRVDNIDVVRELFRVPGASWRHVGGFAVYSYGTARRIQEELRRRGVELVHVQCVSSNGYYALRAARALGLPLVVTMQGELTMDADRIYEKSAHLRHTWRRLLAAADVITACSQYSLNEAERAYGQRFGDRARVVYNGISPRDFAALRREARERPYVLGLGRLVRQKGYDLLVDAFAQVAGRFPHELLIVGDGPERSAIEEQVRGAGLRERVHFLGSVSHERALELFGGAAAFVLASRHEPQGIVVLEAMAAGAPVVAAAVGGVPEVVTHERTGLLFEGGSATSLAEALRQVLADGDLARTMVDGGRRAAADYHWDSIVDQYDELYADAITRHARVRCGRVR